MQSNRNINDVLHYCMEQKLRSEEAPFRQVVHCGQIGTRAVIWIVAAQVQSNWLGVKHFQRCDMSRGKSWTGARSSGSKVVMRSAAVHIMIMLRKM